MLVLATAPGVEQLCRFTTGVTVVVVARTVVVVARTVVVVARTVVDVARAVVDVGGVVVGVLVVGVVVVSVVAAAIVVRTTLVVGFDGVPFVLLPQPVSRRADVKTTSATPETYPLSCLNQTTLSPGRSEVARVYTLGRHNEGRSDAADGGPGIGETDHRVQYNCVQLQRVGRVLELAQARGSAGLRRGRGHGWCQFRAKPRPRDAWRVREATRLEDAHAIGGVDRHNDAQGPTT